MEAIGACGNKICEKVVDQVISEASNLCRFNNIVADFEKGREVLLANREGVEEHAKQAKNQNKRISKNVENWEKNADELIKEDTQTKKTCFFGWFPDCIWRYHRGKDLKKKTQEINKLNLECQGYTEFSLLSAPPDIEYFSTKGLVEFESRKSASKELLDALKGGDHYVIGLWGIGGAGKTTLATQVGKEVKESRLFDYVIRVTVSNPPIIKKIQDEIASPLGLKLESEHDRAKGLWMRLTNGEKILIILDDVWEELNFEEIGIPSSNDHNNCRVLLTTRKKGVCESMKCSTLIELGVLSEEDAWLLFQECAGLGKDFPKTKKNKGQKIAKECKGLPLAITTIASTLRGGGKKEWDMALRSLRSIDHNDEDLIKIYKRLKVSYDNLRGKEAQKLFLLCSVFPEDYEISVEELTIYAKGLGIFEEVNSFEKARDHLHRARKKLIDSCLLLKANEVGGECVKMHDLLHDLAHWMQKGKIKVITEHGSNQNALQEEIVEKRSSFRYLYCRTRNDFSDLSDCQKLEILILDFGIGLSMINIPDTIFEGMKDLKVCTLSGIGRGPEFIRLKIPISFEVLRRLRTLTLSGFSMGDISVLEKLQMLESLRFEVCSFYELPSGIVQLKKLKLLSLTYCEITKNPFEVMGQIVLQLEELYFIPQVGAEVVTEFLNKCPPLKRYHIQLTPQSGQQLSYRSISRALSIAHFGASTSNATVNDLIKRAEILHLHELQGGYKTIIPDFVEAIGEMNELIEIILKSCSEIEFLVDTTKGCSSVGTDFSELAKVRLISMGHLKALCQGPPLDFLKNIQKMDVIDCQKMTCLFTLSIAQSLVLLKGLFIYNCGAMESMITVDSEEKGKAKVEDDHDQLTLFPKLEALRIKNCPQFKGLLSVDSNERQLLEVTASWIQIDFPALERLELTGLPSMIECSQFTITTTRKLDCLTRKGNKGKENIIIEEIGASEMPMVPSVSTDLQLSKISSAGTSRIHDNKLGNEGLLNGASLMDQQAIGETKSSPRQQRRWQWQFTCNKLRLKLYPRKKATSQIAQDFVEKVPEEPISDAVQDYRSTNEVGERVEKPSDVAQKTSLQLGNEELINETCLVDPQLVIGETKGSQSSDSQCSHPFDTSQSLLRQSLICRNITTMAIESCHKLTSLFAVSVLQTMLLETLVILSCDGLKHIITDDNNVHDHKMYNSVIRKLKYLGVHGCNQLKYVFGQSHHEDHLPDPYDNVQIQIDFPTLESLRLESLPSMISICQNNYHAKLLALQDFQLKECPQFTITTIRQLDCSTRKDSGVIMDTLEKLEIKAISEAESIFCLEVSGQDVISRLKYLILVDVSRMSYIFKGPKHMLSLEDLTHLSLRGCGKLKVIISTSLVRSFPKLKGLIIADCDALEKIVEEDEENQNITNPCFPELEFILVRTCRKLKRLFCMSTLDEFPKLVQMVIADASDLEQVFGGSDHSKREEAMQNNVLPKLKTVILVQLPSLTNVWPYKLQTVENFCLHNCQKLFLTSTRKVKDLKDLRHRPALDDNYRIGQEYSFSWDRMIDLTNYGKDSKSELYSSQSNKKKENIIIEEIGASEMPSVPSVSTNSKLIKIPSASTSRMHDNELGNEGLTNEASLVDQQAIGETKDKDGETVGQSVGEITNPPPATLIPPLKESALELAEKESSNQAITMDQMAFGQTKSDDMKESVQERCVSHIAKIVTSSQTEASTSGLLVASLPKTSPQDFVEKESKESNSKDDVVQQDRSSNESGERVERPSDNAQNTPSLASIKGLQTGTYLNEDTDIFSLFDSMEKDNQFVDKAFADLETYLNMPLKDIARSESTNNGLVNALKFLSSWSSENESSLEALKATIDSLLRNLPSILSSFKQASTTIGKFTTLEEKYKSVMKELPRRKEAANTLEKSTVDAQQRKAYLKEKFDRLQAELKSTKNEIKEHEDHLLSLEDQKEKLHVETANFFKEFETIKKNKSEMVGDQSKAQEQLREANYDWIAFSNRLKQKCCVSRNLF